MGQSATETVWVEDLQIGAVCKHPLYDDAGILLIGGDTTLTSAVIEGLAERGIESLQVDPRDAAFLKKREGGPAPVARPKVPRRERKSNDQEKWGAGIPLRDRLTDRFSEPLDPNRREHLQSGIESAKSQMDKLVQSMVADKLKTAKTVQLIADEFADYLVDDHDQTVGDVGQPQPSLDLAQRSIKLSSLGMAVAVEMGMDGFAVCEVGTTGLLHDIGLHTMDPRFVNPSIQWTDEDFWEYQKHSIISQQQLCEAKDVPNQVCIAVEQVHEQFDGSGFPRGMKGQRIHPYARILNVVDAYLQLILPNDSRPGIVPHDALGILLHQARHGLFDPQVIRAFLLTESLFPLGSHVQLSNGAVGTVIRRPRDGYSAPVIEVDAGERVEVSDAGVKIERPAVSSEMDQIRVPQNEMQDAKFTPLGSYVSH